jgi:hypothetical protein
LIFAGTSAQVHCASGSATGQIADPRHAVEDSALASLRRRAFSSAYLRRPSSAKSEANFADFTVVKIPRSRYALTIESLLWQAGFRDPLLPCSLQQDPAGHFGNYLFPSCPSFFPGTTHSALRYLLCCFLVPSLHVNQKESRVINPYFEDRSSLEEQPPAFLHQ